MTPISRARAATAPAAGRTAPAGGMWMLGADGGVFTLAGAPFEGSLGNVRLNAPVVSMAATRSGRGYWITATDGGVFSFGDARLPRLHRRDASQPAGRRHQRDPIGSRLLARRVRRRHLLLRRRALLRLDGQPEAQTADRRDGSDPVGSRLLARRVRRRGVLLRRRPLLRQRGRARISRPRSSGCRRPRTAVATGSRRAAAKSWPSATRTRSGTARRHHPRPE